MRSSPQTTAVVPFTDVLPRILGRQASTGCVVAGSVSDCAHDDSKAAQSQTSVGSPSTRSSQNFRRTRTKLSLKSVVQEVAISLHVQEVASFSEDELDLLRGTPISKVLLRGASVLSDKAGSAATYQMSQQVEMLAYFISHNWSVSRIRKFLCLVMHFNQMFAATVASVVFIAAFILQATGTIPLVLEVEVPQSTPKIHGVLISCVTAPVFVLALFFKSDILHFIRPGANVFLDKTCIHQTCPHLKELGILKLGAFLTNSECMLVIYSDAYMKKLWTVLEVACFFTMCPGKRVEVVHVSMPPLFLLMLSFLYLATKAFAIPGWPPALGHGLVYPALGLACTFAHRQGHRALASTCHDLASFDVRDANCFDEADRPKVERIIDNLMKYRGIIAVNASTQDALNAFNELVQSRVLDEMKASLGTSGLPYVQVMIASLITNFAWFCDGFAADVKIYGVRKELLLESLLYLTVSAVYIPLASELVSWLTSKFMQLSGWKEWAWIVFSCLTAFALCMSAWFVGQGVLLNQLFESKESTPLLCAFLLYISAAMLAAAVFILWQRHEKITQSSMRRVSAMADTYDAPMYGSSDADPELGNSVPRCISRQSVASDARTTIGSEGVADTPTTATS